MKESDVFKKTWHGEEQARELIAKVEALVQRKEGDREALEKESVREIKAVVGFCREKFGDEELKDATGVWVQPSDEDRKMGQEMTTGGKGFRQF